MKRLLIGLTGIAVLAFAAVALTGAVTSAQEADAPVRSFLSRVAEKLGVSEDDLKTAIDESRNDAIDEAVADGRLTEEQAQRLKERAADGDFGFGFGPGPRHGPGGPMPIKEAALQVLGIDQEALRQASQSGQSLLEVAEAQGMTADEFTAALVSEVQSELDARVAEGAISQERADSISANLEEMIDRAINFHPDPDHLPPPLFEGRDPV